MSGHVRQRAPDALFELCDALLAGSGLLGACALTRAGVPEKPRQPLQGAHPCSDRRGSSPAAARCQPATELARRLRRRRLDPRPLRCRDEPRARLSLLGLQILGRPADRGGMVLPVDLSTRLGARQLDRPARRDAHHASHGRDDGHDRPGPPATTPSRSARSWPVRAPRCSCASARSGCSTPTPLRGQPAPSDGRAATGHASPCRARKAGPKPTPSS